MNRRPMTTTTLFWQGKNIIIFFSNEYAAQGVYGMNSYARLTELRPTNDESVEKIGLTAKPPQGRFFFFFYQLFIRRNLYHTKYSRHDISPEFRELICVHVNIRYDSSSNAKICPGKQRRGNRSVSSRVVMRPTSSTFETKFIFKQFFRFFTMWKSRPNQLNYV